jgi:hypothetical protein
MDTEKALKLAKVQLEEVDFAIEQIEKSSHKERNSILTQAKYLKSSLKDIIEQGATSSNVWADLSKIQFTFKSYILKVKSKKTKR